jgi:hypothetical protein
MYTVTVYSSRTGAEVIAKFLDVRISFEEKDGGCHLVTVGRPA